MCRQTLVVACLIAVLSTCYGQIADEKCKEYAKITEEKIPVSKGGIPGPVGKVPVVPGEFPHMVTLGYGPDNDLHWLCAGSLISEKYVLTSATCTYSRAVGPVTTVRMGDIDQTLSPLDSENVQEFKVAEIIKHPGYKPPQQYNDIALLKLDGIVKFSKNVRPACLYTSGLLDHNVLSATGWGRLEWGGDSSDVLMKVYLDLFTHAECADTYKTTSKRRMPIGIDEKTSFCAGGRHTPKDTCQGDSGGPVQVLNEEKNVYGIAGITSFGKTCGVVGQPAVYTKVFAYLDWIEKIVWT